MNYIFRLLSGSMILLLCSACNSSQGEETKQEIISIKEIGELLLAETETEETFVISGSGLNLSSIRSLEDLSKYVRSMLSIGSRVGVYSFKRYIVAYVDLQEMQPERVSVDIKTKSISIILPPIQIKQKGRDATLKTLHERVSGNQPAITPEERQAMKNKASEISATHFTPQSQAYKALVREAIAKGKEFFTALYAQRGYRVNNISFEEI